MPKMDDVARRAGVSKMTVSRMLNGTGPVKQETRNRIIRAMEELDYKPHSIGHGMVVGEKKTIMLIVPDLSNPFFSAVARGMEHVANNNGYQVILANTTEDSSKELEFIQFAISRRISGIVIAPVSDASKPHIQLLEFNQIPFVFVDREVTGFETDVVKGDMANAAQHLVEYLIQLGHERIAIVTGLLDNSSSRERLLGYTRALKAHRIPYRTNYVKQAAMTREVDPTYVQELLNLEQRPTAMFVANLFQYAHTVQELKKHQIAVPKDMSIVSFRNTDDLIAIDSSVTSVIQPTYNFGSLSTQLLIERIEGKRQATTRIVLQSDFVESISTTQPRGAE